MPSDHEITARDLRRARGRTLVEPPESTGEGWDWTTGLSRDERRELETLREEREDLLARVDELHVAAQEAHGREVTLRAALTRLAATGALARRGVVAELRRDGLLDG